MNKISPKRRALYLRCLGYVPKLTLTREERIKCGLKVNDLARKREKSCSIMEGREGAPGVNRDRAAELTTEQRKLRPRENAGGRNVKRNTQSADCLSLTRHTAVHPAELSQAAPARFKFPKPKDTPGRGFSDLRSYITKDGRLRLKGADYAALRRQAYERAGGRCERAIGEYTVTLACRLADRLPLGVKVIERCERIAPWDESIFTRGHLAHRKHGPRKSDVLDQVIWSCAACHFAEHGPRWRKQIMAKAFKDFEFESYYQYPICLCGEEKCAEPGSTMCDGCREHLSKAQPALLHVIDNGTGDPLLQAMGEFMEIVRRAKL